MAEYDPVATAKHASVLSIGALSKATGVPVETLRTWERRYGFPKPVDRSDSGHRRYPLSTVERVRLVVRALDLGHKPSVALRADADALRELLAIHDEPEPPGATVPAPVDDRARVQRWLGCVARFDGDGLLREVQQAWNEQGSLQFLTSSVGPFLHALGDAWESGDLEVSHEHFASEHLREFLSAEWRPLSERANGPRVVCATPAGEQHVLGLHIAALAMAGGGSEVLFLGADTPARDVAAAAIERAADAVALSASTTLSPRELRRYVRDLQRALKVSIPIAVGGEGFTRERIDGTELKDDLYELVAWAKRLVRRPRRSRKR